MGINPFLPFISKKWLKINYQRDDIALMSLGAIMVGTVASADDGEIRETTPQKL